MNKDIENTKKLLKLLINGFKSHNITFWLDAGGLLKLIRNGDILPSSDLDIGVWQYQMDNILKFCQNLRENGFKIRFQRDFPYLEDEIRIQIPESFNTPFSAIDIMLYNKFGNEAVKRAYDNPLKTKKAIYMIRLLKILSDRNLSSYSGIKNKILNSVPFFIRMFFYNILFTIYIHCVETIWCVIPVHHFEILSQTSLYGLTINIPSNVEQYLQYRYGEQWNIPNKNWRLCDGNVIRLRKPSLIPKQNITRQKVISDIFTSNNKNVVRKNIYHFKQLEIEKIRSLDQS